MSEAAGSRARPPGLRDVAARAAVSHQTVSRVLNGQPKVSAATRARVLDAMRELGYRPNPAARALVTGRSRTLGVLSTSGTLFGPASVLAGVQAAATERNYAVSVVDVPSLEPHVLQRRIELLLRQGVEGILAIAPLHDTADALLEATAGVPLVAVEGQPEGDVTVVAVDQVEVGRLATRHLLEAGHATVHHVTGRADFHEAQGRLQGWRSALETAGLPVPPPIPGDWSPSSGHAAAAALTQSPEVTAVFVANDQMALGLLCGLRQAGRRVPQDLSLVGVDDMPEAAYFDPPLTTVRQDFRELGRRSLDALLRRIDTDAAPLERILLQPELVVRDSVGPPPRALRGTTRRPR